MDSNKVFIFSTQQTENILQATTTHRYYFDTLYEIQIDRYTLLTSNFGSYFFSCRTFVFRFNFSNVNYYCTFLLKRIKIDK